MQRRGKFGRIPSGSCSVKMGSVLSEPAGSPGMRVSFRTFRWTLLAFNLGLVAAGATYASIHAIPVAIAAPILVALLVQVSIYLVPGFPEVRRWLEFRLPRAQLASLTVAASLAPYLIYSAATEVFAWSALAKLFAFCLVVSFLFLFAPQKSDGFLWQDVIVLALLAYPAISGVTFFHEIYATPTPKIPSLVFLGKIMLIPLGATAYLLLRGIGRTGFQLRISGQDLRVGLRNYLFFLPIGVPLALGVGFVRWGPKPVESLVDIASVVGSVVGIYLVVSLGEELYFRGIIQNLLTPRLGLPVAQLIASLLFGLVHLPRGFPNWRYALLAAVAGWFYGRAYAERRSVVASSVTHTLVVVTWRHLFH